jgi:hypothetical protein
MNRHITFAWRIIAVLLATASLGACASERTDFQTPSDHPASANASETPDDLRNPAQQGSDRGTP